MKMHKRFLSVERSYSVLAALALTWPLQSLAAGPEGEFDCLIEPFRTVEVRSPVVGVIDKIHVQRGGNVHRGQLLVSLDSRLQKAATEMARYKATMDGQAQAAESRVDHASSKLKRKSELAEKRYGSVQDQEDADAEHRLAKADLQAARETRELATREYEYASAELAQRQIVSPIDGIVVDQSMFPGELAGVGDGKAYILKLAQVDPLRVKAILPMALYSKVKYGMRAQVTPEKPIEGRYTATVTSIDGMIDAASGTFQVRLDLGNAKGSLPGGLKCRLAMPAN
jgi:RND family efflux transporter MFP subunit